MLFECVCRLTEGASSNGSLTDQITNCQKCNNEKSLIKAIDALCANHELGNLDTSPSISLLY